MASLSPRAVFFCSLLLCIELASSIECFFQRQSRRDHFCVIYHATSTIGIQRIEGHIRETAGNVTEFEGDDGAQPSRTLTTTENMFVGAEFGANCTDVLEQSIEPLAPGLVNYLCTAAVYYRDTIGVKCCSFGEQFQSSTASHRHAHTHLAREIVVPARRTLLNRCFVASHINNTPAPRQPGRSSWCPTRAQDLCFDVLQLPYVDSESVLHLDVTNGTVGYKGCHNLHLAVVWPSLTEHAESGLLPGRTLLQQISAIPRFLNHTCHPLKYSSPTDHQLQTRILCLCRGTNCNSGDLATTFYEKLLLERRELAAQREQRRLRAERMQRDRERQQLQQRRSTATNKKSQSLYSAEQDSNCDWSDSDCLELVPDPAESKNSAMNFYNVSAVLTGLLAVGLYAVLAYFAWVSFS